LSLRRPNYLQKPAGTPGSFRTGIMPQKALLNHGFKFGAKFFNFGEKVPS
jgi:hypothetical protein